MAAVLGQSQRNHPMAQELHAQEQGSHLLGCCWEPSTMVLGATGRGSAWVLASPRGWHAWGATPLALARGDPQNEVAETAGMALVAY